LHTATKPTVFVADSRQISQLPAGEEPSRHDDREGLSDPLGDANGADEAVQQYLADKSYPNVLVHA